METVAAADAPAAPDIGGLCVREVWKCGRIDSGNLSVDRKETWSQVCVEGGKNHLAQCTVAAAGYIGQDAVKAQGLILQGGQWQR